MPLFFTAPLSSDITDTLRGIGVSAPRQYAHTRLMSVRPIVIMFKAQVTSDIAGGPYAEIPYYNVTVGAYTDLRPGWRVIVSPTNSIYDARAITFRLRDNAPTSDTLYTSENSEDLDADWYIFVLKDPQLTDRLARPLSVTEQAKDYDKTFELLAPVIDGIEAVYISYIDKITGKFRIAFDVSSSYTTDISADGTLDYLWELESGTYTLVSGSLTGATPTVDFDEGHSIGYLTITDSNGVSFTRSFDVFAHGDTFTPSFGFGGVEITGELANGFTATATAFTGVDTLIDETFAVVWRPKTFYNGVKGDLITGRNIDFIGWINSEDNSGQSDPVHSYKSEVSFEFVGVAARLALLEGQILALRNQSIPDEWDEIQSLNLSWRGVVHFWQRHTTALNLFPLAFSDSMQNEIFTFPLGSTEGGNELAGATNMAKSVNGVIEFAPDGRMQVVRDMRFMTQDDRDDIVDLITFDKRDLYTLKRTRKHFKPYGKVTADGAYFDGTITTAVREISPGYAQGSGAQSGTLPGQILAMTSTRKDAEDELRQRGSDYLVILNDEGDELTVEMPGAYWPILIPSTGAYTYSWELDGTETTRKIVFDSSTKWLLKSVQTSPNENLDSHSLTVVFVQVKPKTSPGDNIPPLDDVPSALPDIPDLPAFDFELPQFPDIGLDFDQVKPEWLKPPSKNIAKSDGNTHLFGDASSLYLAQNLIVLKYPQSRKITPKLPSGYTLYDAKFDPANRGILGGNNRAYALASNGTDSIFFYTANVFNPSPTWVASTPFSGIYTRIIFDGSTIGVYSPGIPGGALTTGTTMSGWWANFNFKLSDFGVIPVTSNAWEIGYLVLGSGYSVSATNTTGGYRAYLAYFDFPPVPPAAAYTVTKAEATVNYQDSSPNAFMEACNIFNVTNAGQIIREDGSNTGTNTFSSSTLSLPVGSGGMRWKLSSNIDNGYIADYLENLYIEGTGTNPFTGGSSGVDANVRYSTDSGATWGSPVTAGTSPSPTAGGADGQRAGTVTLAGAANAVELASTVGGAFSTAPGGTLSDNPVAIMQPYYTLGSTTNKNTTTSTPDFAVLTEGVGSSFKWITGAGVATDHTPVSGFTGYTDDSITGLYGTHVALLGKVGSAQRVYACVDAGGSWTWVLVRACSASNAIRCRRNDTSAKNGGAHGQLFICDSGGVYYTSTWTGTPYIRHLPITPIYFDPLD